MRRAVLILCIAACGGPAAPVAKIEARTEVSGCDAPPAAPRVRPARHEIIGRVLDTRGRPVAGAVVGAGPAIEPAAPSPPATTDAHGAFRWTVWIAEGMFGEAWAIDLVAQAPNGDRARIVRGATDREPVTVVVHGTREIAGRVTSGGVPLAGAELIIGCDRVIAAVGHECADTAVVRTDASGAFRARVAAPATYFIEIRADLLATRSSMIQVLDRDRADLEVGVPAVESTSLRVVDGEGNPLAGVAVDPLCTGEPRLATGTDGRVEVRVPAAGLQPDAVFSVCFAKPGHMAHEIIRRPADATVTLQRSATLCGRVREAPNGREMTVIATTAPEGERMTFLCRGCETDTVQRQLPAPGPFRLEVPAGSYRVWVDVAGTGGAPWRRAEVRPGAMIDVGVFDLPSPIATLSGVVRGPGGKPVPFSEVYLQRLVTGTDGHVNEEERKLPVGAGGRFSAAGLPAGRYRIQYGNQSEELELPRAGAALTLDYDPSIPRGCETCGPEPFDADTYDGPWIPAFDTLDDTISGPRSGAPMAAGVLPGDVIEQSDGQPGGGGLPGKRNAAVRLRIFRGGTGQHLDVTVKRTMPERDY